MKKYLFFAILALVTAIGAHAEARDIAVAGQFAYGSKNSMAGLGLQVQIEPITNWRIAPEFIYYLKNDGMSALNANLNIHYVIPTSNSFALYPMAGFTFSHFMFDSKWVDSSSSRCGANIGIGAQYRIKEQLHFFTEQRFQILKDWNQSVTLLGLKYTF